MSHSSLSVEDHADRFLDFINTAPTVFHAIAHYASILEAHGFQRLSERNDWSQTIVPGGKYFLTRNSSSLVAFVVGRKYRAADPVAMIATHMDALTMRLKPVSEQREVGYELLKVAPYSGGGNFTWWNRDLGLAGRVMVKETDGKIRQRLIRLNDPLAKIVSTDDTRADLPETRYSKETEMTPIMGLTAESAVDGQDKIPLNTPTKNHSPRLLSKIAAQLNIQVNQIKDLELELFDHQPASRLGIDGELLSVPRCDDKLCSYAALEALLESSARVIDGSTISLVASFDDEEIGSLLRQAADSNFLPSVLSRVVESLNPQHNAHNLIAATLSKSFLISADVDHAVNPNFSDAYGLQPRLNVGPILCCDTQGGTPTDAVSRVLCQEVAERCGGVLQLSHIRNGEPAGGTIGPMVSAKLGVRGADVAIGQLGMHSVRGTTGSLDPGLGVKYYRGYFEHFEETEGSLWVD